MDELYALPESPETVSDNAACILSCDSARSDDFPVLNDNADVPQATNTKTSARGTLSAPTTSECHFPPRTYAPPFGALVLPLGHSYGIHEM